MSDSKPKPEEKAFPQYPYFPSYVTIYNKSSFDLISTYAELLNPRFFYERPKLDGIKVKAKEQTYRQTKLKTSKGFCPVRMHLFYEDYTTSVLTFNLAPADFDIGFHIAETSRSIKAHLFDHAQKLQYTFIDIIIENSSQDNSKDTEITEDKIENAIQRHISLERQLRGSLEKTRDPQLENSLKYLEAHIQTLVGKKYEFQGHELFKLKKYKEARVKFELAYNSYKKVLLMIKENKFSPDQTYTDNMEQLANGLLAMIQHTISLQFSQFI